MDKENLSIEAVTPPKHPSDNKKWKLIAIIMIVLAVILAAAMAFLAWKYFENDAKINDLNNAVEQANTTLEQYKTEQAKGSEQVASDATTTQPKDPNVVTVDELRTAYEAAGKSFGASTVRIGKINNSSIAPYQTLFIDVNSPEGPGWYESFFRKNKNSAWQYGYGGQQGPSCTMFSAGSDEAKAFADNDCVVVDPNNDTQLINTTFKKYLGL